MTALLDLPSTSAPAIRTRPGSTAGRAGVPAPVTAAGPVTAARPVTAVRPRSARPRTVLGGNCAHDAAEGGQRAGAFGEVGLRTVRLTRRGRLTITLLTVLCSISLLALAAAQSDAAGGSLSDAPASVVVEQGDTLWQIAREIAPADSPAEVVRALQEANGLDQQPLRPGQVLRVPTG